MEGTKVEDFNGWRNFLSDVLILMLFLGHSFMFMTVILSLCNDRLSMRTTLIVLSYHILCITVIKKPWSHLCLLRGWSSLLIVLRIWREGKVGHCFSLSQHPCIRFLNLLHELDLENTFYWISSHLIFTWGYYCSAWLMRVLIECVFLRDFSLCNGGECS